MKELQPIFTDEIVISKIYVFRSEKVMLDYDIAELYGVETRALKQAVNRNIERFPSDFMFKLTNEEIDDLVSHFVIPSRSRFGGAFPYAFTDIGVSMLSSVLKSKQAILVNMQIMRVFAKLRNLLKTHTEILKKLDQLERKGIENEEKIILIFEYLKQLEKAKQQELKQKNRPKIGFKKE
jgi:hypothetical protein